MFTHINTRSIFFIIDQSSICCSTNYVENTVKGMLFTERKLKVQFKRSKVILKFRIVLRLLND